MNDKGRIEPRPRAGFLLLWAVLVSGVGLYVFMGLLLSNI